jgi:ATP-dependent Lon protease
MNLDILGLGGVIDQETEFIPLFSKDDESRMNNEEVPSELPILPLRNNVLFPGVVIPITVGRDMSIKLIEDVMENTKTIGVVAQKDPNIENPTPDDLNKVGTVARIIKMLKMPDGSKTVIIQGQRKFQIDEMVQTNPYFKAKVSAVLEEEHIKDKRFDALIESVSDLANKIIHDSPNIPSEASVAIKNIESPSFLVNFIASNLDRNVEIKQELLSLVPLKARAEKLLALLTEEFQILELKNDIQNKVKVDIDKQQRDYFLNQQMRQIQEELGGNPIDQELQEFKKRAKTKKFPKNIKETFEKELAKLERLNPSGVEYSVQANYIDTILELPWEEFTKDNFDLKRATKVLDKDHFGLEKVKERILEHLAVLKIKKDMKAPILCLAGPPGVGKTSLGKSIAEALGRKYVRMSLGGLRDEAEIRGHRKTYIGAMPGRVIQSLKKAGSSNPVFILDEIDKVGHSAHGDPSSALLEVLDPEQNSTFYDNFVEMEYDLSKVMFVATANNLAAIQPALRDRLEIIEVSGYTVEEKSQIAKKHLIPRQLKDHGITKDQFQASNKTIVKLVEEYTRESGVRNLEKRITKLIRQTAKHIAMEEEYETEVKPEQLKDIIGPGHARNKYEGNEIAGVVTGLAWTSVGGDILFIETSLTPGKGALTLTGQLGSVMKESATVALQYLKAHAADLGLKPEVFEKWNVHLHFPAGAIPKDGPSAGITIFTALASLFTQRKVRNKMAMTGEITLRGKVLPVGGIKEKILAAKRANVNTIILCEENRQDIEEIDDRYLKGMTFEFVANMDDVIEKALLKTKVKNPIQISRK